MRTSIFFWIVPMCWLAVPAAGSAEPFAHAELFLGRSVKPPAAARSVTLGLHANGAPLDLAIGKTRDRLIDESVQEACGSNATCKTKTREAIQKLETLSDADWARIESAAGSSATLDQQLNQLVASGQITASDKQQIETFVSKNATTPDERRSTIALARQVAETRANILLAPYGIVNLELLQISAELPLVLTLYEHRTDIGIGNFNTDFRFGHRFDLSVLALGLSYGLHLYFPTGGGAADPAAYSFLFHSPRYLHRYLTWAPYVVFGADFPFVTVQTYAELVSMHRVRGGPGVSNLQYFQYGVGLTILPDFLISVVGELSGLAPLNNASDFNALFGLGGVRLRLWLLELGVAVQAPIFQKVKGFNLPPIAGISLQKLASLSVLAHVAVSF